MSRPGLAAKEVEIARWNVVAEVSSSIYKMFSRAREVSITALLIFRAPYHESEADEFAKGGKR